MLRHHRTFDRLAAEFAAATLLDTPASGTMERVLAGERRIGCSGRVMAIAEQLARRRRAAQDAWALTDQVVLIGAGDPIPIPGRADLTYPFTAHSEYFYLTDRNAPGGVLAFDPRRAGWTSSPR